MLYGKVKKPYKVLRVAIVLLLIFVVMMNATYSWFQKYLDRQLSSNGYITVSAEGLVMKPTGGEVTDEITLYEAGGVNNELMLEACSSFDGSNVFFPLSGAGDKYRYANPDEENRKYLRCEFTLASYVDTDVWISNQSFIRGAAADNVRVSIDLGNDEVKVFDGSENGSNIEVISGIEQDDTVVRAEQNSDPFNQYFYTQGAEATSANSLMTLKAGEHRKIVLTVWLEFLSVVEGSPVLNGTDDLQVNLMFTTGIKDSMVMEFVDVTFESWVCVEDEKNFSDCIEEGYIAEFKKDFENRHVFLRDTDTNIMYAMKRDRKALVVGYYKYCSWTATVPSTVRNIEFVRLDYHNGTAEAEQNDWEFWNAGSCVAKDKTISKRFSAFSGGYHGRANPNAGVWERTTLIPVYFKDVSNVETDTKMYAELSFRHYSDKVHLYMRMTYIGNGIYAVRIPTVANYVEFLQNEMGIKYPESKRNNNNLYTSNDGKTGGTWTKDSTYP